MSKSDIIFNRLYKDNPELKSEKENISKAFALLLKCAQKNALIMVCGNGGSAADCEHITGGLMKGFLLKRPLSDIEKNAFAKAGGEDIADKLQKGIKCISLVSQTGLTTAFANDADPTLAFGQQVYAYAGSKNDVLIALSTSGNSENIVKAAICAKAAGIKTFAITGSLSSRLSELCDVTIRLPEKETYRIQELTLPVYHALCAGLEAEMFSE